MKRNFNIYLLTALLFILSSCSIAGSWVYERADSYLAEYFKEYANFSDEQEDEIDKVTKDQFTLNKIPWRFEAGTPQIAQVIALKKIDSIGFVNLNLVLIIIITVVPAVRYP